MESSSCSKICGEECDSSESGWTMYIGSSIDHHGGGYGGDGGGGRRKTVVDDDDDVETDDSMASDASSGPSQQPPCGSHEIKEVNGRYKFSSKKYKKAMQKKKGGCEEELKDDRKVENMGNDKNGVVQSCNSAWSWGRRK